MADPHRPPLECWMVALLAVDDKEYVYRVYAPDNALLGDLFWTAFHTHDDSLLPRALDHFDTADIWLPPN